MRSEGLRRFVLVTNYLKNAARSSYRGDWYENDGNDNCNECLLIIDCDKEVYVLSKLLILFLNVVCSRLLMVRVGAETRF